MKKRIICLLLALILSLPLCAVPAAASGEASAEAEAPAAEDSGTDDAVELEETDPSLRLAPEGETPHESNGLGWRLTSDGVLTLTGSGTYGIIDMYYGTVDMWWNDPNSGGAERVRSVVVEEGITGITKSVFSGLDRVTRIELPSTLVSVDDGAFVIINGDVALENCPALEEICYHGTRMDWIWLVGGRDGFVPDGVTVTCLGRPGDTPSGAAALLAGDEPQPYETAQMLLRLVELRSWVEAPFDREKMDRAKELISASVDELYEAIGRPNRAVYEESCLVIGEMDGLLYYNGFVVETIRCEDGRRIVADVYEI